MFVCAECADFESRKPRQLEISGHALRTRQTAARRRPLLRSPKQSIKPPRSQRGGGSSGGPSHPPWPAPRWRPTNPNSLIKDRHDQRLQTVQARPPDRRGGAWVAAIVCHGYYPRRVGGQARQPLGSLRGRIHIAGPIQRDVDGRRLCVAEQRPARMNSHPRRAAMLLRERKCSKTSWVGSAIVLTARWPRANFGRAGPAMVAWRAAMIGSWFSATRTHVCSRPRVSDQFAASIQLRVVACCTLAARDGTGAILHTSRAPVCPECSAGASS
jgi:hypothetical protein